MPRLCFDTRRIASDWVTNLERGGCTDAFVSTSYDKRVRVHSAPFGSNESTTTVGTTAGGALCCASFEMEGAQYVAAGDDLGNVAIFGKRGTAVATLNLEKSVSSIKAFESETTAEVAYLAVSSGKRIYVLKFSKREDENTLETTGIQKDFVSPVNKLIIHNTSILCGGDDLSVKYFNLDFGKGDIRIKTTRSFKGLAASATALHICSSEAGREILVAGCYDGSIKLWSLAYSTLLLGVKLPSLETTDTISQEHLHSPITSITSKDASCLQFTLRSGVVGEVTLNDIRRSESVLFKPTSLTVKSSQFALVQEGDENEVLDALFVDDAVFLARKDGVVVKARLNELLQSEEGSVEDSPKSLEHCSSFNSAPSANCRECGRRGSAERERVDLLASVEASFLCKLDSIQTEKVAVVDENKRLLSVIKNLMIENERLKSGLSPLDLCAVNSSDEGVCDEGYFDLQ